jgi:hypothetical protein
LIDLIGRPLQAEKGLRSEMVAIRAGSEPHLVHGILERCVQVWSWLRCLVWSWYRSFFLSNRNPYISGGGFLAQEVHTYDVRQKALVPVCFL